MQVLILHCWQGSVDAAAKRAIYADHWQTWLARRLADARVDVRYPTLPDPDSPRPEAWDAALADPVAALDPETERVVVCHSLACVAWLRMVPQTRDPIADRVLLVAPPSPDTDIHEVAVFFPVPLDPAAVKNAAADTRLVCSDDDPYCPEGAATSFGAPLAIPVDLVPNGGHLNPEAGYGPWPAIEAWVRGLAGHGLTRQAYVACARLRGRSVALLVDVRKPIAARVLRDLGVADKAARRVREIIESDGYNTPSSAICRRSQSPAP